MRGDALVGEELTALISTDLVGQIESWGWHRCIRIPACQTIPGATTSSYTPTVDDAWHVLRVIAVAARDDGSSGGVSAVIGPVINPDPEPFHQEMTVDASDLVGVRFIVAPGPVSLKVDAACPVQVVAGIRTATPEGSTITAEYTGDEPAKNHTHILDGDGGELTVGVIGECSTATITVDATL